LTSPHDAENVTVPEIAAQKFPPPPRQHHLADGTSLWRVQGARATEENLGPNRDAETTILHS